MFNIKHTMRGFTVAELLLAMAIVGIVTAALVPMLKYHKAQPKQYFTPHGIAECYYRTENGNDVLYLYTKDNSTDEGTLTKQDGDSCSLTIPNSNYYELHVIDPGQNGGGYSDNGIDYMLSNEVVSEGVQKDNVNIITDTNFSNRVGSLLPEAVHEVWKDSDVRVPQQFEIKTPLGKGPYSITDTFTDIDDKAHEYTIDYGKSNRGNTAIVRVNLGADSVINQADYPNEQLKNTNIADVLKVDDKTYAKIEATQSNAGATDAYYTKVCHGKAGESCNNNIKIIKYCINCSTTELIYGGENGRAFSIESKPLVFSYTVVNWNYIYGMSGKSGAIVKTYYERLRDKNNANNNTIVLQPARVFSNNNHSSVIINGQQISSSHTLENAKYKGNSPINDEYFKTKTIDGVSKDAFPVPEEFKKVSATDIVPDKTNYHLSYCAYEGNGGLCNDIKQKRARIPGAGGYGGYPMRTYLSKDKFTRATVTNYNNTTYNIELKNNINKNADSCLYTVQGDATDNDDGRWYCSGTQGGPGAVILLW